jgi:23S rRNA (guanosine2251-2'-O)-methyltransferase
MRKLLNNELNRLTVEEFKKTTKIPLIIVLDNIRSQHNIGAVFRTSDAFLIEEVYLCGITATPPNAEIHKSALGAECTVEWKYFQNTLDAINQLIISGYTIVSIEQADKAIELSNFKVDRNKKYAVVFGNEVKGVLQDVVSKSNYCVEIAQYGTKHSLNISITAGIVIWEFFNKLR